MSDELHANLKAAVYLAVSTTVEEELQKLSAGQQAPTTATPTYIASLVELVYNQIINLGEDLESFANHAGRVTVNPSELYMVTRKNAILTDELKKFEQSLENRR